LEITEEHDLEKYDRWARVSTDYQGELPQGLVTLRRVWLRPWTYNRFKKNDPETYEYLKAVYPEGAKVTLINDKIAKCEPEILDDHWTFTQSPLSSHIHAEPIGAPLAPIQELRNELVVLKLQTIEYGIPETFADPSIFDFEKYEEHKASPGAIYPVKQANAGQPLESSFVTLKTATYPKEATDFQKELDADGQFVTGAFPSIYGGSMPSASKTAAEYQMSRNQALQRLQTTWKVVSRFWAKMMDKSVRSFVANMTQDERFTVKKGKSYINVYIRQSELKGRVGQAEPEIANTFPLSWMQKRDVLLELMQLNNEFINEALFHPENTGLLSQYMGFKDFYIPGDDDRTKQLLEIQALLETEPMEIPPAAPTMENPEPQPILQSTIPVDPEMDKHQIEYETCTAWMVSEVGLDAKETNPAGYANVRAHASEHLYFWQMQQQAEMEAEAQQENANGSKGSKKDGDGSEQKAFSKSGKE
jgi:hypothetical protein